MSGYLKKTVILKGEKSLKGENVILRLESGYVSEKLKIEISAFPADGDSLFAFDGKNTFFTSETTDYSTLDSSVGISFGLFSNSGELLAFGAFGKTPAGKGKLSDLFSKRNPFLDGEAEREISSSLYDDEKLSDINYFDNRLISEDLNDKKQNYQYDEAKIGDKTKKSSDSGDEKAFGNETIFDAFKAQGVENPCNAKYYETVRAELTGLFLRGTKEFELERVIPESRWVRINYTIDKFYIVGVIEKCGKPNYICYGVPGNYGSPPEKLKEYSSFVPKSLFDASLGGYYIMFQSALNGEKVTPKIDVFGF